MLSTKSSWIGKNRDGECPVCTPFPSPVSPVSFEAFVEGTGRDWDWDDFCSLRFEDRELDAIRLKCINLIFTHPPPSGYGYCNEQGIQLLREVVNDLCKLPD